MLKWFKQWLAKYDAWCQSMGLTPENKRSCVPYRSDSTSSTSNKQQGAALMRLFDTHCHLDFDVFAKRIRESYQVGESSWG